MFEAFKERRGHEQNTRINLRLSDGDMGALYSDITASLLIWAFGLIWSSNTCAIPVKSSALYWYPSQYCKQISS